MTAVTVTGDTDTKGRDPERLLQRLALIAQAEEQAAIAGEQARTAEGLGPDALECAGVVTLALAQIERSYAAVCARMADAADAEGDVLLSRALRSLVGSLEGAARNAEATAIEAHDFNETIAAEKVGGEDSRAG